MDDKNGMDGEFSAMQSVYSALEQLEADARERVLGYVSSRLGITTTPKKTGEGDKAPALGVEDEHVEEEALEQDAKFGSFAELYDATQPKSQPEKALVGGYWLQVCQGLDSFDSFSINKELKNLGEGVTNITSALDSLKTQKPALCLQLKKSGKSRQARKTYKVTVAGIKEAEAMIGE